MRYFRDCLLASLGLLALLSASTARADDAVPLVINFHLAAGVSPEGPQPVVNREFLEATVARASAIWSQVGIRFRLGSVDTLPPGKFLYLWTRGSRHAIARAVPLSQDGAIDVFLVRVLADLDGRGTLPGVHWHTYSIRGGRYYVILGARSVGPETLAHELGHYFGLDHSLNRRNIMRPGPDRVDARLAGWQLGHAKRRLAYFLERGMLRRDAIETGAAPLLTYMPATAAASPAAAPAESVPAMQTPVLGVSAPEKKTATAAPTE